MQKPLPEYMRDKLEDSSEFVDVVFETTFRCKICGWKPYDQFGCIPAMEKHLQSHGIKPSDGKLFWLCAPSEEEILKGLSLVYT